MSENPAPQGELVKVVSRQSIPVRTHGRRQPRRLQLFLTLLESNFSRLEQIIGDQALTVGAYQSTAEGDLDIVLAVVSRSRYTTELAIGYDLNQSSGQQSILTAVAPRLSLRVYHDAKLVEVIEDYNTAVDFDEVQRWRLNQMLSRWLDRIWLHGHHFIRQSKQIAYSHET
ncbi:MAG: DUF1249 domain-containing protein [Gammaproteobacteria bacterium]|nr:DUF1249 domain-containing protein [Gammaproteobacteria bacterium]